jgi:hypothetical protein
MRSVLVSSFGGFGAHLLWNLIDKKNLVLLTPNHKTTRAIAWIAIPAGIGPSVIKIFLENIQRRLGFVPQNPTYPSTLFPPMPSL